MAKPKNSPFYIDVISADLINNSEDKSRDRTSETKHATELFSTNDCNSTTNRLLRSITDNDFRRLKDTIRCSFWSLNHSIRRELWINISTLNRTNSKKDPSRYHSSSQTAVTTTSNVIDPNTGPVPWPKFVDTNNLCFYYLTESKGQVLLKDILLTFEYNHPDLTYSPTIEPIAALLLHYNHENDVFFIINRLFMQNRLCAGTALQWEAICNTFPKLLRIYYKSAANFMDLRYSQTKNFYHDWIWWIFRYLPFSYLVKIIDCLLIEGPKCLYRISLTLVHLFAKKMKSEPNGSIQNPADFCQNIPISIEKLLRKSFRIRNFKQKTIDELIEHEEELLRTNRSMKIPENQPTLITSQYLTTIPDKSILNRQQFLTIWNWLPIRLTLSQPILVFTTDEHGFRLQSLLNKIDELEYTILIIKTTTGEIFGSFCSGLWSERHQRTYFGFGETFLFTLVPKQIKYPWVGKQQSNDQNQVKRELFLFVDQDKLIIGGGNGDGIYIDQSLCQGHTNHCETFDNPPLCSQIDFTISVLEMFALDFSAS